MPKISELGRPFIFFCTLLFALCDYSIAQEAAFGLSWNKTAEEVRQLGVEIKEKSRDGRFIVYTASKIPKSLSIAESYTLIIHAEYGLQKIIVIGKSITNDPYGNEGKEKYSEYKRALVARYGQPTEKYSAETIGNRLYKERDEFYQCLRHSGCGLWSALWTLDGGGTVALNIKGLSAGQGFLTFNYEGPKWADAVDGHKVNRNSEDQKAL
jgi:hypothetical protein